MTTVTVWGGSSSTDWHTAANWTNGVPTTSLIASIPSAPSNQPTMSSDGTAHALQLDSGATLTGGSNITLYITGESAGETDAPPNGMAVNLDGAISGELSLNITTNATTSVDLNPTSGDIHDLTLASTGTSLIINSENTCTLTGDLTITKGKFNANSNNLSVAGTITVNSVAGGDAEIDIGDVVADCAKIAVESGDTITAAHSSNALTVDGNGIGTGRSIDFTGIISGTLDIICTHPNTTEADLSASSGVINHLTLNHASLVMKMNSSATVTALTITAGEFSTVDSGGNDKDLTVTGKTEITSGTLTLNGSTCLLNSGGTAGGLVLNANASVLADADSTVTMGSIEAGYDSSINIRLAGTNTINNYRSSTDKTMKLPPGVVDPVASTTSFTVTTSATNTEVSAVNLVNLTFTPASGTPNFNLDSGYGGIDIEGDLQIGTGVTITANSQAIAVGGDIHIDGTLTGGTSTISGRSVHIDGTFTHDGALTCTGIASTNYAFQNLGTWTPGTSQTTTFSGDGAGTYHVKSNDWNNVILNAADEN